MARELRYRVTVDTSDVKKAGTQIANAFNQGISGTVGGRRGGGRTSSGTTSTRGGRGIRGQLGAIPSNLVAGVVAGVSIRNIIRGASALNDLNVQAENADVALVQLAGSAGEASRRVAAIQRASRGSVSALEATQLAARLSAVGLGQSAEELERVFDAVMRISTVTGRSTEFIISNLQLDVLNKTGIRLDQIALEAAKVDAVFKELDPTLQSNAARLEAILRVAEETFGTIEPQVSAVTKLGSAWRDFSVAFSEAINPATVASFSAITGAVELYTDVLETASSGTFKLRSEISKAQKDVIRLEQGIDIVEGLAEEGLADPNLLTDLQDQADKARGKLNDLAWVLGIVRGEVSAGQPGILGNIAAGPTGLTLGGQDVLSAMALPPRVQTALDAIERLGIRPSGLFSPEETARTGIRAELRDILGVGNAQAIEDLNAGLEDLVDATFDYRIATSDSQGQLEIYNRMLEDTSLSQAERIRIETEISRINQDIADDDQRAAEKSRDAWLDAAQTVKDKVDELLGSIPGLPGFSGPTEVTQEQMALTAAGVRGFGVTSFVDTGLRELKDQIVNQVDRGFDLAPILQAVETSTGLTGLGGALASADRATREAAFGVLEQQFASGALFGTEAGQQIFDQLVDVEAIEQAARQTNLEGIGREFVRSMVGSSAGPEFQTALLNSVVPALQDEGFLDQMAGPASMMANAFFDNFRNSAAGQQWAAAMFSIWTDQAEAFLENMESSS